MSQNFYLITVLFWSTLNIKYILGNCDFEEANACSSSSILECENHEDDDVTLLKIKTEPSQDYYTVSAI